MGVCAHEGVRVFAYLCVFKLCCSGEGGVCVKLCLVCAAVEKEVCVCVWVCVKLCLVCYTVTRKVIEVHANDYMMKLVEQANLHFIVTGKAKETGQIVTAMLTVAMRKPKLIVKDPALSHSFIIISMFFC